MASIRTLASALVLGAGLGFSAPALAEPRGLTLDVNSLGDDTTPGDGLVTLREAIIAAQTGGTTDLGQTGGGPTVPTRLDLGSLSGAIVLEDTLPAIEGLIRIDGPADGSLRIDGDGPNGRKRILVVAGGFLDLINMELRNGLARGGAGGTCQQRSGCGGGGAGLGGSILLDHGFLSLAFVRISDSVAEGGAGGSRSLPAGDDGGGGGGGLDLAGGAPSPWAGGDGADGVPLSGLGGVAGTTSSPPGAGGEGAGGGGGAQALSPNLAFTVGAPGGFGGGGGGGGRLGGTGGDTPLGGSGGFGGGGGGRGCKGLANDGPGGPGGEFAGDGGSSSGDGNVGGGGGGGAGLGGAIFARSGFVELMDVRFSNNRALRGAAGSHFGNNGGGAGQGKGGALFLMPGVEAVAMGVTFEDNAADDASGTGFTPGSPSDTNDVHGVLEVEDGIFRYGFE